MNGAVFVGDGERDAVAAERASFSCSYFPRSNADLWAELFLKSVISAKVADYCAKTGTNYRSITATSAPTQNRLGRIKTEVVFYMLGRKPSTITCTGNTECRTCEVDYEKPR
jgi:hypothetical protein